MATWTKENNQVGFSNKQGNKLPGMEYKVFVEWQVDEK